MPDSSRSSEPSSDFTPRIIIHGGVTEDPTRDYQPALAALREIVRTGHDMLMDGAAALDVAQECVRRMEISGQFLAGKGSIPNADGAFELDASIMDGETRRGAGVAAVRNATMAVVLARRVLDRTNHCLIVGDGVRSAFGKERELFTDSPEDYYRPIFTAEEIARAPSGFGTVGAAVFDRSGKSAAATATCGVFEKLPGRVGDTAVLGAGTYADSNVAVSCTGQGEYFLRCNAAREVSARVRLAGDSIADAADAVIEDVGSLRGLGGLIAATASDIAWAFNTFGLKRAWIAKDGEALAAVVQTPSH